MFFHNLPNFSPYSGHIYDELKVPFVTKGGKAFERSNNRFDLLDREGYFPFHEYPHDGRVYFISDAGLYELFAAGPADLAEKYEANYLQGWPDSFTTFKSAFFNGYRDGLEAFGTNIGPSYVNLTYKEKLMYLRVFCLRCLDFLFFDGDLDEKLFYNLGYLQANLYRGFTEINNLLGLYPATAGGIRLHFESYSKALQLSEVEEPDTPKADVTTDPKERTYGSPKSIEIMYDPGEVRTIWQTLTAPIRTKKGTEQHVFTGAELDRFLGAIFQSGSFPDAFVYGGQPKPKMTSRGDMRNVLVALMYATYNLNRDHNRSANLIDYVSLMKARFTVFSNSTAESIKSTMSAHSAKGIDVLKNSIDVNPHIEKTLTILKKHKLLH